MADDYQFRDALRTRIARYRQAENAAHNRLAEVQTEFDRLRARREAAEALYHAEFGTRDPTLVTSAMQTESVVQSNTAIADRRQAAQQGRTVGPFAGLHWEVAIEHVLREAGSPLHVREIWRRLSEGGFRTNTADPERSVTAIAVRSARLVRAGPNTYALVTGDAKKEDAM